MIRVQYRWRVHPGAQESLEQAWATLTRAIRATQPGAMGSTLLRDPNDPTRYSAIARWRSRADWEAFQTAPAADPSAAAAMAAAIVERLPPEFYDERSDLIISAT